MNNSSLVEVGNAESINEILYSILKTVSLLMETANPILGTVDRSLKMAQSTMETANAYWKL